MGVILQGMAAITLDKANEMLDAWIKAELAVATTGQSYTINTGGGSRSLTRANISEIRQQINFWRGEVSKLQRGRTGPSMKFIVPRDL